jgi:hypothetical protein
MSRHTDEGEVTEASFQQMFGTGSAGRLVIARHHCGSEAGLRVGHEVHKRDAGLLQPFGATVVNYACDDPIACPTVNPARRGIANSARDNMEQPWPVFALIAHDALKHARSITGGLDNQRHARQPARLESCSS